MPIISGNDNTIKTVSYFRQMWPSPIEKEKKPEAVFLFQNK